MQQVSIIEFVDYCNKLKDSNKAKTITIVRSDSEGQSFVQGSFLACEPMVCDDTSVKVRVAGAEASEYLLNTGEDDGKCTACYISGDIESETAHVYAWLDKGTDGETVYRLRE